MVWLVNITPRDCITRNRIRGKSRITWVGNNLPRAISCPTTPLCVDLSAAKLLVKRLLVYLRASVRFVTTLRGAEAEFTCKVVTCRVPQVSPQKRILRRHRESLYHADASLSIYSNNPQVQSDLSSSRHLSFQKPQRHIQKRRNNQRKLQPDIPCLLSYRANEPDL